MEIELPGSFVVLQGLVGDGMANTVDTVPDFDGIDESLYPPEQQQEQQPHGPPQQQAVVTPASAPSSSVASSGSLGSWMLPPSATAAATATQTTATPSPTPTATNTAASTTRRISPTFLGQGIPQQQQTPGSSPLLVPSSAALAPTVTSSQQQQPESSASTTGSTPSGPLTGDHPSGDRVNNGLALEVQRAVDLWHEECAVRIHQEATEWLLTARHYSDPRKVIPILNRVQAKWWLASSTQDPATYGQLRVFNTLPDPQSPPQPQVDEERLPPGTTLVGTSLHTFKIDPPSGKWIYLGYCTDTQTARANALPMAGCMQFMQLESPFEGFVVYSVDGYPTLAPGLPSSPIWTGTDHWWWKVTCPAGAFVRQGLDLNTQQLAILPFGTHVQVSEKVVNAVGLSRLYVRCVRTGTQGWCSELLNPMSGQRGPILQPLALPVPVVFKVRIEQGAVIRRHVELSSPIVRVVDRGDLVTIRRRQFSEFPTAKCIPRLQLYENGWLSLNLNNASIEGKIIQATGLVQSNFDPKNPGWYHWRMAQHYRTWENNTSSTGATTTTNARPNVAAAASMGNPASTQHVHEISSVESGSASDVSASGDPSTTTRSKSAVGARTPSSASGNQRGASTPDTEIRCVCCEDKFPNATIVHGDTGHICCCLECARICKAQNLGCPLCRMPIELVILHYYA